MRRILVQYRLILGYAAYIHVHFFFEYVAEAVGNRTHAEACELDLENDGMCMADVRKREQTTHHPPLVYNLKGRRCSFVSLAMKEHRQH